ncbi:MAG: hypothetical protein P4L44_10570 [Oryzomonas sp.]|uniref:hypothetical protein n=1 Tax=Oryzomonas sp. TaxID=2855186 RepID=UPI00284E64F7|nr:hypothetical protein [Oryzomonas sp.]MDR3580395.1 hypothetical protein [Oryzomonas sp.]
MKIVVMLLVCLMSIVGCTQVVMKNSVPLEEKQKAVEWIKNNNVWGLDKKSDNLVKYVEINIDNAIKIAANSSSENTAGSNFHIDFSNKMMKSGKYMTLIWRNSTFSVREMTEKEISEMKIPGYGLKKGYL